MMVVAVLLVAGTGAEAQAQRQGQPRDTVAAQRRAVLERQVRQRIATVVKERLDLTDAQAQQLQEVEGRSDQRRRDLMQREMRLRRDLRQQLSPGVAADQQRVASLLDQVMAVHRERVAITEQEQRELARFLTPVQRAKYLGLQGELRSRIEGMRQRGEATRRRGGVRQPGRPPRP
jgi:Spy/CpxP family protein refolding chaperone